MHLELTEDQKITVMNSDDVYDVMKRILLREQKIDRDQEHFWIICLAPTNKILNIELVTLGSLNMSIVKPMQVFRIGIQKGAVRMILVHNHPSEHLRPSEADKDITDRLIQVGNIVDIEVIDHLIISLKGYYSFQKSGLLEELKLSEKWVPRYVEKEKIRKEALKLGKKEGIKEGKKIGKQMGMEKGEKKKAKEMAKKSLKEGLSINLISKLTGLSKEEIEKL